MTGCLDGGWMEGSHQLPSASGREEEDNTAEVPHIDGTSAGSHFPPARPAGMLPPGHYCSRVSPQQLQDSSCYRVLVCFQRSSVHTCACHSRLPPRSCKSAIHTIDAVSVPSVADAPATRRLCFPHPAVASTARQSVGARNTTLPRDSARA